MVRFKNRWLLVEFIPCLDGDVAFAHRLHSSTNLSGKQIYASLKQSVVTNFGDAGWGAVGYSLTVKYYSPTTNICIIRVGREQVRTAWGAVTLLSSIDGTRVLPNVVHISGTIKQCQLAAITHNREIVGRFRKLAQTPEYYHDSYENFLKTSTAEIQALQD